MFDFVEFKTIETQTKFYLLNLGQNKDLSNPSQITDKER